MNILKEITKNFQYEENLVNPEIRKLISGPFRGVTVNRNGVCYSRTGKTMKVSIAGFYKTPDGNAVIKPWRLCALVWHDQTPSLHLDEGNRDKYLNLLSFIKLLEKYPDEYELVIDGTKTNYYPLSKLLSINVLTGCLVKNTNIKLRFPTTYSEIKWDYFNEICEKTISDFRSFKDELSEELKKNLKSELPKVTEAKEEDEPEEELEVCLSDPELGGAPSLKPKVKEDHSQSDICHSDNSIQKEKEMNDYSDIPGYDPSLPMEAQESSVLEEIELRGYRDYTPSPNITQKDKIKSGKDQTTDQKELLFKQMVEACKNRDYARSACLQSKLIKMGVSSDEIRTKFNEMVGGKYTETKEDKTVVTPSSSDSIEELQKLFDRRSQLKKELAEIEEKIKDKLQ